MQPDIYEELQELGVFAYGADELLKYEKHLSRYFAREYERYSGNTGEVLLDSGPLALDAEDLADQHYDEGLAFFQNFLDAGTMSYTMAYFDEDPRMALSSQRTLDQAQTAKFGLLAERMRLEGGEKLLNLGCGFGYFESYLLDRFPDIQIASLTHSKDQYAFVQSRVRDKADALSSSRFSLYFGEIDDSSSEMLGKETYDVVCSVGLVEQINNISMFFGIIDKVLRSGGRMFHHLIVSRDLIPQLLDPDKTLIGKYFPGGKVLPYEVLRQDFGRLEFSHSWFVNGMNYWRTLDYWHENFWRNLHEIYPGMMDAQRVRYWNDYFVLCKAMFYPQQGSAYGNGQYLYYKTVD